MRHIRIDTRTVVALCIILRSLLSSQEITRHWGREFMSLCSMYAPNHPCAQTPLYVAPSKKQDKHSLATSSFVLQNAQIVHARPRSQSTTNPPLRPTLYSRPYTSPSSSQLSTSSIAPSLSCPLGGGSQSCTWTTDLPCTLLMPSFHFS